MDYLGQYLKDRAALEKAHSEKVKELNLQYAQATAVANVGDIVKDAGNNQHIKVTRRLLVRRAGGLPFFIYSGQAYTKDRKPFKNAKECRVDERDLVMVRKAHEL